MWLNGSFLGVTQFNAVALPSAYSSIQFNGECKIGFIHISNYTKSDAELDLIDRNSVPEWLDTTLLLATFDEETTDAGSLTGVSSIDNWNVFRRSSSEATFSKLKTVAGTEKDYIDYTAQANKSYKYQIYPVSSTTIGNALETAFTDANFYGWYLIDEENNLSYKFNLEVSTGEIPVTTDATFINTQSKYPTQIINGNMHYERGTISALYGSVTDATTFEQTVDELKTFEQFINNGKEKILKSRKGHIWRVKTYNFSISNFSSEEILEQPYMLRFDWVEIGEV